MNAVWTYWEGPRPPHIEACLHSMRVVLGDQLRVVTPDTVAKYIPEGVLHPAYRELVQPALTADCVRAALLATHGGWWWDADTVALNAPDGTDDDCLYATWTRPPRRVLNGYIYFRRGSLVAGQWLTAVNAALNGEPDRIDWCAVGEKLLTPLVTADDHAREIPRAMVLPIDIDSSVETFFGPGEWRAHVPDGAFCFGLNHSYFVYHHGDAMNVSPEKWGNSPILVHQLLAYARAMK